MSDDTENGWQVWLLPGILAVVLVVVIAVTATLQHSQGEAPDSIEVESGAGAAANGLGGPEFGTVRSAASEALLAYYSLDYRTADDYVDSVTPMLTDDYASDFAKEAVSLRETTVDMELVLSPSIAGDGEAVAVEYVGDGRAQVLVALDVSTTSSGEPFNEESLRIRVQLEDVDGAWLADEFQRVAVRP